MGNMLRALEKPKEALVYYDRALEINSQEARVWFNKAATWDHLGQLSQAVGLYRQFLTLALARPKQYEREVEHAQQRLRELERK